MFYMDWILTAVPHRSPKSGFCLVQLWQSAYKSIYSAAFNVGHVHIKENAPTPYQCFYNFINNFYGKLDQSKI